MAKRREGVWQKSFEEWSKTGATGEEEGLSDQKSKSSRWIMRRWNFAEKTGEYRVQ